MRYRNIEYTVVQGIKRGEWKWSTSVAGTAVSGKEPSKAAAVVAVEKTIDRALDSKTVRLVKPPALRRPRKVSERPGAIPPTKAETGGTPTVRNYRHGPHAHLVKVTSRGTFASVPAKPSGTVAQTGTVSSVDEEKPFPINRMRSRPSQTVPSLDTGVVSSAFSTPAAPD
jgi:hypothetical protein